MEEVEEAVPRLQLPLQPPIEPMLAKLTRRLPVGDTWLFEPKWDGFRALVFWDGDQMLLQSRDLKPLGRYFPEVEAALRAQLPGPCILDGEIVIAAARGLDFDALLLRIHPAASRVAMLARQTPASFVAFDILATAVDDLTEAPLHERRQQLVRLLQRSKPPVHLTAATTDRTLAERWFERFEGAGLDGVVAKPRDLTYRPGERAMLKIKHQRTADCLVVGFRWNRGQEGVSVGSLMLGLYDADGTLHHAGFTSSFKHAAKRALVEFLEPYRVPRETAAYGQEHGPGGWSRWSHGVDMEWQPLRPELVCEVAFDHWQTGTVGGFAGAGRFRHGTTFLRWRTDKPPRQCTLDQLTFATPIDLQEVFSS